MKKTINFRGHEVGYTIGETYVSPRGDHHIFKLFSGFGISAELLDILRMEGIKNIVFKYKGEKGFIQYSTSIKRFMKTPKTWIDVGKDLQKFVALEDMKKREYAGISGMVEWNDLAEFIQELCFERKSPKIPQATFYEEIRERTKWHPDKVAKCLHFLKSHGDIRIGDNFCIIYTRSWDHIQDELLQDEKNVDKETVRIDSNQRGIGEFA